MHSLHHHVFSYLTLLGINDSPGTVIDRGQAGEVESTTVDYQLWQDQQHTTTPPQHTPPWPHHCLHKQHQLGSRLLNHSSTHERAVLCVCVCVTVPRGPEEGKIVREVQQRAGVITWHVLWSLLGSHTALLLPTRFYKKPQEPQPSLTHILPPWRTSYGYFQTKFTRYIF